MRTLAALAMALAGACSSDDAPVGAPTDSGASGAGGVAGDGPTGGGEAGGPPGGGGAGQGPTGGNSAGGTSASGAAGRGGTAPDGGGGSGALDRGWTKDCKPTPWYTCEIKMCAGYWMEPAAKRCCTTAHGPCGMDFQDGKGCIPCAAPLNPPKDS